MRILVVEDEPKMAGLLRRGSVAEDYAVDVDGLSAAAENPYDAIVLDVMLPDLHGVRGGRHDGTRPFVAESAHAGR